MVVCPACDSANPDGYRFCGHCGGVLAQAGCPSCGAVNPNDQRFCGQCGAALGQRAPAAGGAAPMVDERKLATVLFADVVGFTALAERTDPEVVARMVDAAFRQLGEVVREHGGRVDKYMGDSVMAVFGVPAAHDDDAERAVAAGLAMRQLEGALVFSIGINSGAVMATAVGGTDDVTVIGDTVNVAARLEKAAAPGEVLCGRLTAELAGGRVAFRPRQPVLLKGKREPVEVWEAVSLRGPDGDAADDGPVLVGRHDELAFLEAHWRRVCGDGTSRVVVVCGEAGSGKTRLTAELARIARLDGEVVRASYPAYGATGGGRVATEILRQLGPADDPDVDVRVRSIAGEVDPTLQSIDPASMQQEQTWALGRLLHEKSAGRPMLVVIDDMHRSGEHTLAMLSDVANRLGPVPVMTVLAGRNDPSAWLTWFPAATTVRLGPLGHSDALALANGFAGDKPLSPEAADVLVYRAGGNPLYLRELMVMARRQHVLVDDGDHYRLTTQAAIPATLQALLAARLDALDPAQKLAVQHVAVLGDATADKVAALGSPDAPVALRVLVDGGLLSESPEGVFDTVDPMLREVAYEALPRNVRGELHRRAAAQATPADERARHLERAADYLADTDVTAEAIEALIEAATAFLEGSRHQDAVRLLEQAVALGCRRPSVLLDLARVQAVCGKPDEAFATLAMVDDDPNDPTVAAERDHTAANTRVFTDPAWSVPRLLDIAERWRRLGNAEKEAWAHANAGVAYFYLSRMEDAGRQLEEALAMFERTRDRTGTVATSSFLCLAKPTDGRVPAWLSDGLAWADQAGDRSKQITALTTLAWHHFFRSLWGRPEETAEAEGFARRLAALSEELGATDTAVHGYSLLTITERFSGRIDDAVTHVGALERLAVAAGNPDPWLGWAASFAVAVANGVASASPPFPPASSPDPVAGMAGVVIEAELALSGRHDEAVARIEQADRPELGPIGELAGIIPALALVLAGRGSEALRYTDRAAHAARRLGSPPALLAAAALRAEIASSTAQLPPPPQAAQGVSEALLLRAHAVGGASAAAESLRRAAKELAMPGLLLGL